jgi:hypothetical protein
MASFSRTMLCDLNERDSPVPKTQNHAVAKTANEESDSIPVTLLKAPRVEQKSKSVPKCAKTLHPYY